MRSKAPGRSSLREKDILRVKESKLLLGIFTLQSLKTALSLAPFMLLGLLAGMKSVKFLDEKTIKHLVVILLIISGILMIINNF